jgi:hypothetical protein
MTTSKKPKGAARKSSTTGGSVYLGRGKPVFTRLTASMTREQKLANLLDALKKSGIEVNMGD